MGGIKLIPQQETAVKTAGKEPSSHDRRAALAVSGLLAFLVFTIGLGLIIPSTPAFTYSDTSWQFAMSFLA
jgi:hypothetical protein